MSSFGLNTCSTLRTPPAPINLAWPTAITTTTTPVTRAFTTTRPVTVTTGTSAAIVTNVPSGCTYMKLQPVASNSGGTITVHVVGWNQDGGGTWRPMSLGTWTVINSGTVSVVLSATNYYAGITYTKVVGDGKSYDVNSSIASGGFLLMDVCGCEIVEIIPTAGTSFTANAFVGFI